MEGWAGEWPVWLNPYWKSMETAMYLTLVKDTVSWNFIVLWKTFLSCVSQYWKENRDLDDHFYYNCMLQEERPMLEGILS